MRSSMSAAVGLLSVVTTGALVAACGVVDVGPPVSGINTCRPDQAFFAAEIYPNFLAKDFGGRTCGDSQCHDNASGRQLRVFPPTSPPYVPFAAGSDWDMLYRSAAEQMSCANVRASELYTRPAGLRSHGGSQLIAPDGPEAMLLDAWVNGS
jgi:hypothetical protein